MGERDESNLWVRLGDVYAGCEMRVHTLWLTEGRRGWMATMSPRSGVGEAISVTGDTLREVRWPRPRRRGSRSTDESAGRPDS
jgi:hypothetical protein